LARDYHAARAKASPNLTDDLPTNCSAGRPVNLAHIPKDAARISLSRQL
jgi:hypothetical protein